MDKNTTDKFLIVPFGNITRKVRNPDYKDPNSLESVSVPTTTSFTSDEDNFEEKQRKFEEQEEMRMREKQAKLAANKNTNMFRTVVPNAILAKDAEVEAKRQAYLASMKPNKGQDGFGDQRYGGRRGRKSRKSRKSKKSKKSRKSRKSRR